MSRTNVRGGQILDASVQRQDLDVTTAGQAVITKIVQGSGLSISATGADAGTGDATVSLSTSALAVSVNYVIDGAGDTITTGSKGYLEIPFAMTITGWTLMADQSGSVVVDVKKSTYSGFPTTTSICGATPPTLATAQKAQLLSLSGWTTTVSTGDVLEFVVNSVTTVQRITISLRGNIS